MKNLKFILFATISILAISNSCKKDTDDSVCKAGYIMKNSYYTKVTDTTKTNYEIDLFNDGNNEFEILYGYIFSQGFCAYSSSAILILNDSIYQIAMTQDSISALIINKGEIIDKNLKWAYKPRFTLEYHYNICLPALSHSDYINWGGNKGYIGIRKFNGSAYNYGWINLSLDVNKELVDLYDIKVYDYLIEKWDAPNKQ